MAAGMRYAAGFQQCFKSLCKLPPGVDVMQIMKSNVTWYCSAVKVGRHVLSFGYCSKGQGVAFVAFYRPDKPISEESLKPLIVRDVYCSNHRCDDAAWCWNLKCPLNKAQIQHFRRYGVKTVEDLKRVHCFLEEAAAKLGCQDRGQIVLCYEKPPLKIRRMNRNANSGKCKPSG